MDVLIDAFFVDLARHIVSAKQSFDLAGKDDSIAIVVVVKLLHPEGIARQGQDPATSIPEGDCKNAGDFPQAFDAALFEQAKKCLSIRSAAKPVLRCQPRALRGVIVEFAVVIDPDRPVLVAHRLTSGLREIDDCQPAMAKAKRAIDVEAFPVGAAVGHLPSHLLEQRAVHRLVGRPVVENSGDAAHALVSARARRAGLLAADLGQSFTEALNGQERSFGYCVQLLPGNRPSAGTTGIDQAAKLRGVSLVLSTPGARLSPVRPESKRAPVLAHRGPAGSENFNSLLGKADVS